jgi:protein disulfide-isomerase A6
MVETAINNLKQIANQRLGGGKSSSSGGSKSSGAKGNVVELTDSNFENNVYNNKFGVLVMFFAPWCGTLRMIFLNISYSYRTLHSHEAELRVSSR